MTTHNTTTGETTGGMERWLAVYRDQLTNLIQNGGDSEYTWSVEELPAVLARMELAFRTGTFSHHGTAIQRTCRKLGIRYTKEAIVKFQRGNGTLTSETSLRATTDDVSAEQAFEMRAAFGPGEQVVNILTGRRFRT